MAAELILTHIYIYPIKSLGGVLVPEAVTETKGLQYDRRWMLVDETGTFLTQRVYPEMALLQVNLQPDGLLITHKQHSTESLFISFDAGTYRNVPVSVTIWDDTVPAVEVSAEADLWFSRMLNMQCRLVFMPEQVHRPVDSKYAQLNEPVSFADAYPYLLIGQESLNELNSRLADPLPMNRFRPNLVFSGGTPFVEDTWHEFTVGENVFAAVKPCARCVLTTIDQQTAQKGPEPLRTLATYRTVNKKVMFGQNILPRTSTGFIRTGDVLTVRTYRA